MAVAVIWPTSLPGPSSIMLEPAERRHVSTITDNGIQQASGKQTDYLADENVRFEFTATQAVIFQSLWKSDLLYGGAWFGAQWPCAHYPTGYGVRRFKGDPSWRLIGHEYWEVTCKMQLRGRIRGPNGNGGIGGVPAAGGIRLYDLRMLGAPGTFPYGASVTSGTAHVWNPFTNESAFSFLFSVVSHNTVNLVPPGVEVRISLSAVRTNFSDASISMPVYADAVSDGSVSKQWLDTGVTPNFANSGYAITHLYTDMLFSARAYVDGVDVGQGAYFSVAPDRVSGHAGTGSAITGYPLGQYAYYDYVWGVTA